MPQVSVVKGSSRDLPNVPTRMVRYNKLERQLRDNWAGIPVASWSRSENAGFEQQNMGKPCV